MQKAMSSGESSNDYKDGEPQGKLMDFANRHNLEATSAPKNVMGKENLTHTEQEESTNLYSRAIAQEKEIQYFREQISLSSIKVSQLLNEKYSLETKFSELRMALDEKQSEVINSASNELARRKGDLEVNLNLLSELKVVEEDKHIFMSAMLGILAEYDALPHATNASALSNSIKQLHDQLQLKIRTSHARLTEVNSMIGASSRNGFPDKEVPSLSHMARQFPSSSLGVSGFSHHSHHVDRKNLESVGDTTRYIQDNDPTHPQSLLWGAEMHQLQNNDNFLATAPDINRNSTGRIVDNMLERSTGFIPGPITDQFSQPMQDGLGSFGSEDGGPGIEYFQIIGDAKPGCKLLGCGFPVRGTSLCMFQWVRHYPDGTRQYIEGATNPDYLVTADDVDQLIAVECIPMDEQGRQGDLVRVFANDNDKITCDEDMQEEINTFVSNGSATFVVLIILDSSDNWEPATLFLKRSSFQVKVQRNQDAVISDKYSKDMSIKIPSGLSAQFVLTCSNGTSYPFSTNSDVRIRDTLVLTMRIFLSKAVDEKRRARHE